MIGGHRPAATWWPLVLPAAATGGALAAVSVPLWLSLLPAVAAGWWGARHRSGLMWVAVTATVALGCTALSSMAWDGLAQPLPNRIEDRVTLVKDPRPVVRGVRVEIRHLGVRYDAFARGAAAGAMTNLRAGESVELVGRVTRRDPSDRWRASRHVAGLIEVEHAGRPVRAQGPFALANAVHRAMGEGARDLPPAQRGVLLGVSVGDRSALPAAVADDLRAAGLSHLTAVSGQHVALLLAMLAPVMKRLPVRPRAVAVAVVLACFVVLTRGEPSVLRAVGMAVAVEMARSGGQHVRGVRVLGLTVTTLLVIDPLLVWSVAFQLSVAATLGIAVGASRLAGRLPGPAYLTNLVAMGICAQLAVAPLAVAYFGQIPVTGLMANVLVAPVIGLMMGWGLTVGVVAGLAGVGTGVVHLPTMLLGGWLVSVAEWFAGLPVGQARATHVVVVSAATAVLVTAGFRGWFAVRRLAAVGIAITLGAALMFPAAPASGRHEVATGAEVLVGGGRAVVVVDGRAEVAAVLAGLRTLGVVRVVTVVSRTGSAGSIAVGTRVCERLGPCEVLIPGTDSDYPTAGGGVVSGYRSVSLGELTTVVITDDGDRLGVELQGPDVETGNAVGDGDPGVSPG